MTIQEFLDIHLPTKAPKPVDSQFTWAGWIANLYISSTGTEITLNEVFDAMKASGYEWIADRMFAVSVKELGRVDRRYAEKMVRNHKEGKGV